jgi:hypothetical protein
MAQQGGSQIPGRRILRKRRDSVLPLSSEGPSAVLGTNIVQTPEISGLRSIPHFILFLICLYFGFIKKPKDSGQD